MTFYGDGILAYLVVSSLRTWRSSKQWTGHQGL